MQICPTEINCERFESSAGKDRFEKEQNACTNCPAFPTKLNPELADVEKELKSFVYGCFEYRRRKKLGMFAPRLTEEGEEIVLMLDEMIENGDRERQFEFMKAMSKVIG